MTTLTVVYMARPIGKNRRHAIGGRFRLTDEARTWMQAMADLTAVAALSQHWQDPGGPLELRLSHSNARMDCDAPLPLAMDAVAAGLGINDRRFDRVTAERVPPATLGGVGVRVEVKAMEGER